uniref:auxin-responsive protein SAUR50-like n=1 Tax=Erigeron canadensis TaxID=72917 RepID=UPI001CB89BC8|nr:auxin-responsive protein SAUR50-like [Erigeron canadensis]
MVEKMQRKLCARNRDGVPDDVKEGHFAVIALDKYEERRFVVPVPYLRHASFVRLLERSAEEYEFDYSGAVVIPCKPSRLERVLTELDAKQRRSLSIFI